MQLSSVMRHCWLGISIGVCPIKIHHSQEAFLQSFHRQPDNLDKPGKVLVLGSVRWLSSTVVTTVAY